MLRSLVRLTPLLIACGCSTGTLSPFDAGPDPSTPDASAPDTSVPDTSVPDSGPDTGPVMDAGAPVLMGRRSFVVTSTLTLHADGGSQPTGAPQSHAFTVVADADRLTAFVGAGGSATSRPLELTATGFSVVGNFSIVLPGCSSSVTYDGLTLTLGAGGELAGIASGRVGWTPAGTDVGNSFVASMSLTAVSDTEAPVFGAASVAADRSDPFSSFTLTASEPLPPDARPVLVGQSGDFAFVPSTTEAFVITFNQPKLPRYGEQYRVALDGVVDFAGNAARTGSTSGGDIRFTTRAAPPLAAEDGFESATGSLGGAQVMSTAGAPVIAGARSLYIPATGGSSTPATVLQQTQLALRLPLAPGDTVVRFSYREVNPNSFGGTSVVIASPGGTIAGTALTSPAGMTTSAMIGQTEVQLGPLMTAEIALPPDAATEIVIARIVRASTCSGLPVRPVAGLIIDDLRAE